MDSTLVSNLGTQTEKLSTGESIVLLEARLKQQLKPWQVENGKAQFSNYLYQLFDRDNAEMPLKSTYTGLWHQLQKLCEVDPELPELIKLTFILKLNDKTSNWFRKWRESSFSFWSSFSNRKWNQKVAFYSTWWLYLYQWHRSGITQEEWFSMRTPVSLGE